MPADEERPAALGRRTRPRGDGGGGDDERRGVGRRDAARRRLGRCASPTRGGRGRWRRWRPRPIASTRACWPSSPAASWCPRCGCPPLADRALLERLLRRMHLVRLRTSAKNRIFGLLSPVGRARRRSVSCASPDAIDALADRGVPEVWRALDRRGGRRHRPARRAAGADRRRTARGRRAPTTRAALLRTIPGVGWLLGLTFAAEIGDIARFASAAQARRLLRPGAAGPPVRRELADRAAVARPARRCCAGRRSRPPSTRGARRTRGIGSTSTSARRHGHGNAGQVRRRAQGADRRSGTSGRASNRSSPPRLRGADRPGKLRPAPGRLTARLRIEKPGQLPPDTMRRPSAERELSTTSASPDPKEPPLANGLDRHPTAQRGDGSEHARRPFPRAGRARPPRRAGRARRRDQPPGDLPAPGAPAEAASAAVWTRVDRVVLDVARAEPDRRHADGRRARRPARPRGRSTASACSG